MGDGVDRRSCVWFLSFFFSVDVRLIVEWPTDFFLPSVQISFRTSP
jgi:hypothetical protein